MKKSITIRYFTLSLLYMPQIHFLLNSSEINQEINPNITLLDYLRYEQGLVGTKIGCREGDCGACIVLVGEITESNSMQYRNITSCLTPIGNIMGKHVVTIEGINLKKQLTLVQELLAEAGGTQCGFCTVGFVVSLTAYALNFNHTPLKPVDWIDGNICRCTGYRSIEMAANQLENRLQELNSNDNWIRVLTENSIVPTYFNNILEKLKHITPNTLSNNLTHYDQNKIIGGGTDLYVQHHDDLIEIELNFSSSRLDNYVKLENNNIILGGGITANQFLESPIIERELPDMQRFFKLIASMPIRNIATLTGNIVNASPIADFVNILLALDATLIMSSGRDVKLDEFYQSYKNFDLQEKEQIIEIKIPWADNKRNTMRINFEKVSKRIILDIASVNTTMVVSHREDLIESCRITAGGVAPIPLYLRESSKYLVGKEINQDVLDEVLNLINSEISPISDIRGSEQYKRLLLRQLIISHFMEIFPDKKQIFEEVLL